MNELEIITKKYLSKDSTAITYSEINQVEFNKMIQNMRNYERPDILSIYDNKIIGIEHFEFDSYKNTSKGSNFKIQNSSIERRFDDEINNRIKNEKEIIIHEQIKNTSSLKQYYDNFKKVLLSHLENIDEYKQNIINDFGNEKEIDFWFFIEDVTPLGSYYIRKGTSNISLLLPFNKEIIEILENHKEIKGIILGITAMSENKIVALYNDKKTLEALKINDFFKVEDDEFLKFEPQTTGYALYISKEEMEKYNNE